MLNAIWNLLLSMHVHNFRMFLRDDQILYFAGHLVQSHFDDDDCLEDVRRRGVSSKLAVLIVLSNHNVRLLASGSFCYRYP